MKIFKLLILTCFLISNYLPCCYSKSDLVEISVEITEINDTKANELGINWTNTFAAGQVANVNGALLPNALPAPTNTFPSLITVGNWAQYTSLTGELKLLESKGAAQILSNPKILTKSGTSAKVLVGGEFPVISSGVGGGTIQWKEFGIKAEVTPRIMEGDQIDMVLDTEVSRLNYTNMTGGYPSLDKREARSFVKVKSGETITIAGLIETNKQNSSSGIPLLCDLPILGYLFSRKTVNETKTNILIFVTPKIVQ